MIKSIATLGVLGGLCGLLLTTTYDWTAPHIESNRLQARGAVFVQLLPEKNLDLAPLLNGLSLGTCEHWIASTAVIAGYGGPMEFAYVTYPIKKQISLRNIRHTETPGFGDFVKQEWFAERDGASIEDWQSTDAVSGATITFEAVRKVAVQSLNARLEQCRDS